MPSRIRKQLFVLSTLLFFPAFSHAQISQIIFTTDSQSVAPNVLSGPITIQTQDSTGASFPTPETIDLQFISTSPTGEFLGSTGNPVTKTMSTNSANRTFYYEDSTEGSYTLTVDATGRNSHAEWSASQGIVVSSTPTGSTNTSDSSSDTATSSSDTTTTTNIATPSATADTIISTHYSYLPLSDFEAQQTLSVSAGRDRLAVVGNPLQFQAEASLSDDTVNYTWTFGDGTTGTGKLTKHIYAYPGTYAVVLNASLPDANAVSRTTVTVVDPKLEVVEANNQYIKIKNDASQEINLYGWEIISEGKGFTFPMDTIILAGQSVCFPNNVTGLSSIGATDAQVLPIASLSSVVPVASTASSSAVAIMQNKRAVMYQELLGLKQEADNLAISQTHNEQPVVAQISSTSSAETAAPIEAVTSASGGWLNTLKHFFFGSR
jgi:hypothetical protein